MATKADTDPRYQSLLQKAVRRGHVDLVYTVSAFIENLGTKPKAGYRAQTAVITFEECWPFGGELNFNRKFHSKVAALVRVTRLQKNKDAVGLAYLAYALSRGDATVYNGTPTDKNIKMIANAIRRPDDFWRWISAQIDTPQKKAVVENALRFRHDGLPREKAVLQSAAYLALSEDLQLPLDSPPVEERFPYWVVFDENTPEGKLTLRDVARDLHIQPTQLGWVWEFFEGSKTNGSVPSIWWSRHCDWQFQKVGLPSGEAHLLWEPAKHQIINALAADGRKLQSEIYRWKLANLKRIESLKRQVDLFIEHFEAVQRDQKELFD